MIEADHVIVPEMSEVLPDNAAAPLVWDRRLHHGVRRIRRSQGPNGFPLRPSGVSPDRLVSRRRLPGDGMRRDLLQRLYCNGLAHFRAGKIAPARCPVVAGEFQHRAQGGRRVMWIYRRAVAELLGLADDVRDRADALLTEIMPSFREGFVDHRH